MSLRDKLNAAKNIGNEAPVTERRASRQDMPTFSSSELGSIDNMVFGNELIGEAAEGGVGAYDPKAEMERLKRGLPEDMSNCRLPSAILESIRENPLIVENTTDSNIDAFTEKITKSMSGGVKKMAGIIEKLDKEDGKHTPALNETRTGGGTAGGAQIDYSLIKMIVENAITEKLGEIKGTLNETRAGLSSPSMKVMKMTDKFMFLDSDDNVYECQMVYKGKNKRKKQ